MPQHLLCKLIFTPGYQWGLKSADEEFYKFDQSICISVCDILAPMILLASSYKYL